MISLQAKGLSAVKKKREKDLKGAGKVTIPQRLTPPIRDEIIVQEDTVPTLVSLWTIIHTVRIML